MPLTLVLGPANAAKAGEVLGAFAAASPRGAILVVPTAADAAHYARELAADGAVLGSVLTFSGLAREIANRAGYTGRRLTPLQRERVLERALRATGFDALREAAGTAGFPSAAGELIAELERSLVTPQRFAAAMRTWAEEDPRRAGYGRDVAAIYRAYAAALERLGRVDAELYAWRALDALRAAPGRWGARAGVLLRVRRPAPARARRGRDARAGRRRRGHRVADLRARAPGALGAGRGGRGAPAARRRGDPASGAPPSTTRRARVRSCTTSSAACSKPARRRGSSRVRRSHCSRRAGSWPRPSWSPPRCSTCCAPASRARRSRSCAGRPALSAALIERVFGRYGIGAAAERRTALAGTALGRALLALARCALLEPERATAEDVLEYLRAPGLLDHAEAVDRLEAEVRREGLRTAAEVRARARTWHDRDPGLDLALARDRRTTRAPRTRGPSWRVTPPGCSPPRIADERRCSTRPRSSTRARSARSSGRWRSSRSCKRARPAAS